MNSSNYDPSPAWATGCQIVALNYQTNDLSMCLNQGRFAINGHCGYVMKPDILLKQRGYDHRHGFFFKSDTVYKFIYRYIYIHQVHKYLSNFNIWVNHFYFFLEGEANTQVTIKVISGSNLPKPKQQDKGEIVDPYVKLKLSGVEKVFFFF